MHNIYYDNIRLTYIEYY